VGRLWRFLPWSRLAVALWAWRNRRRIRTWASFGLTAAPRIAAGDRADVLAEARLRMALDRDPMTRAARDLEVRVEGRVATLTGKVPSVIRRTALEIATRTKGVDGVRDGLRDTARA
jgi:osmotically-inducible protein OsmY